MEVLESDNFIFFSPKFKNLAVQKLWLEDKDRKEIDDNNNNNQKLNVHTYTVNGCKSVFNDLHRCYFKT